LALAAPPPDLRPGTDDVYGTIDPVHNRDAAARAFDLNGNIYQAIPIEIPERKEWIQGGGQCKSLNEAYRAEGAVRPKGDTSKRTR
jgi:hypothetical protein